MSSTAPATPGAHLTSHPSIAKVSFNGQVSTGGGVDFAAAGGMKAVTMEFGKKSPCIMLPVTDLENAVDGAMMANFFSVGQVYTNSTRAFVPESMLLAFQARVLEKMQDIRPGDLMDPTTNFGPLVSKPHWEKATGYVRLSIEIRRS
ncbi:hypothetical protein KC356_g9198 [Hortaea werneckii]|nr:hypothetical protein KC356_g9198 [Hortaea werneckii]